MTQAEFEPQRKPGFSAVPESGRGRRPIAQHFACAGGYAASRRCRVGRGGNHRKVGGAGPQNCAGRLHERRQGQFDPEMTSPKLAAIREAEQREAAEVLGSVRGGVPAPQRPALGRTLTNCASRFRGRFAATCRTRSDHGPEPPVHPCTRTTVRLRQGYAQLRVPIRARQKWRFLSTSRKVWSRTGCARSIYGVRWSRTRSWTLQTHLKRSWTH